MAKVDFSIVINRPVEDVFAVLSNPRNSPKWSSSSLEMEVITAGTSEWGRAAGAR